MNAFSTMRLKSTKRTRLGTMALKKAFPASNPSKSPSKGRFELVRSDYNGRGKGPDRGLLLN